MAKPPKTDRLSVYWFQERKPALNRLILQTPEVNQTCPCSLVGGERGVQGEEWYLHGGTQGQEGLDLVNNGAGGMRGFISGSYGGTTNSSSNRRKPPLTCITDMPAMSHRGHIPSVTCGEQQPRDHRPPSQPPVCPVWRGRVGWCWPPQDPGSWPEEKVKRPRCVPQSQLAGTGLGYCPPCDEWDYRHLIKPRDPGLDDSARPSGAPYFTHGTIMDCEAADPPLASKEGRFTFDDWLRTVPDREAPAPMTSACVPSLSTWCAPVMADCCPDVGLPASYTVAKAKHV